MRLRPHALTRRHTIIAVVVALVVVGGGAAWVATRSSSSTTAAPTLVAVTSGTIRQSVSASGTLEPAHRADLTFAVSGTVTSVPVAAGDKVRSGAVLATVDTASLKTAVTSAKASVSAMQDQLTAQQDAGSSAVQIVSTQAQLTDAEAKLTDAQTALAEASMTSPIAGTVAQVDIAVGDSVTQSGSTASAASSSATGTGSSASSAGASSPSAAGSSSSSSTTAQIVVISTTSWVVDASVGSADLPQLKKGLQAEITPTGSATKIFGTVKSVGIIASSSSSGSATFPVTITVTGSPKGLYAGGAADVAIIVKQVENVLSVQTNAVHTEGGKTVVHQIKDGAQVSTPVKVGTTYGAVTQILSGLKAGDKVVGTTFRLGGNRPSGGTGTRQGAATARAAPRVRRSQRMTALPIPYQGSSPILRLVDVGKTYSTGSVQVEALHGISMEVDRGEYVAIMGPSGSGKSTLMHILGCLDVPTTGSYDLAGEDVAAMSEDALAHVRNRQIGFVFQQFNLLPALSAWRNVELPLCYSGVGRSERKERAMQVLERVGLGDRVDHRPGELSGGQQQRVAVARALVTDPALILADEPTGNLDSHSSADVLRLFVELHDQGRTIVLITHEREVAESAQRVVRILDGQIDSAVPSSLMSLR